MDPKEEEKGLQRSLTDRSSCIQSPEGGGGGGSRLSQLS